MGGGAPRYQDDDAPKRRQRLSHDRPRHQMRKGRQRLRLGRPAAAVTAPAARCLCALPRASTMYAAAAPGAACALSCVRRFPPNLKPNPPIFQPHPLNATRALRQVPKGGRPLQQRYRCTVRLVPQARCEHTHAGAQPGPRVQWLPSIHRGATMAWCTRWLLAPLGTRLRPTWS